METNISEIQVSYTNANKERLQIKNSIDSHRLFFSCWSMKTIELQEEAKVLLLNRNNQVLGVYPLSKGGVSGTVIDAKLVFGVALKCSASNIIIAHNHPSGNLKPSEADKNITKKLIEAGKFLDIKLLDHLIITRSAYFSFADELLM
ncbi:JAB domain-containing protein [uncultured Algibacter sp.]|uniref:JAB domain-containing protein n=1 Tax=uncultured Algibacter sp. TaxID=298659 RepID=UPI002615973E|nr:JAB domain-containing protein [uncultured Algibacter sp.]